jgi:DNA-binding transcriptional MocR family regulator
VSEKAKLQKRHLVQATAERLRDRVLAAEPDAQIGSLSELAQELGVGIVTVQQVARILEHEGLLAVRPSVASRHLPRVAVEHLRLDPPPRSGGGGSRATEGALGALYGLRRHSVAPPLQPNPSSRFRRSKRSWR